MSVRKFPVGPHYQVAYNVLNSKEFGVIAVDGNTIVASGSISEKQAKEFQNKNNLFKTDKNGKDFILTPEAYEKAVDRFIDEQDELIEKYSLLGTEQKEVSEKTEQIKIKENNSQMMISSALEVEKTPEERRWEEEFLEDGYVVIAWPESQDYMHLNEEDGVSLINDEVGLELHGGSAYIVDETLTKEQSQAPSM